MKLKLTIKISELLLILVTIAILWIVIVNTPFLYAQDAFTYLGEAEEFAYNGKIQFKTGMPFIFVLGIFLRIFGPIFGEIFASRLFMMTVSVILILAICKLGQKFSELFGFFAGLLAIFEPIFLKYSTVPYLEAFAMSAGLIALYFTFSGRKLQTLLSPIFFYIAVLTRPDYYLSLLIPLIVFHFYKRHTRFAFLVYILPIMPFYFYVQFLGTRVHGAFDLITQVALFLTPELLTKTVESVFNFYNQSVFNQFIYFFILMIFGWVFLNFFMTYKYASFNEKNRSKCAKISTIRKMCENNFFSDKGLIAFCLFLSYVIHILFLTCFGYQYNWAFYVAPPDMDNIDVLRRALIISNLHDRYLLFLRVFMAFPLAYPIATMTQKIQELTVIKKIRNKILISISITDMKMRQLMSDFIMFLIILSSLYAWHYVNMWQTGLAYSKDASISMSVFFESSEWLSERLNQNETAMVPSIEVFNVLTPKLKDRLISYESIWYSAGIAYRDRASQEKLKKLHSYFNEFLKMNPKVRYLILDWADPYAKYLFEKNEELTLLLKEVKIMPFTLSTGWSNKITIYEQLPYSKWNILSCLSERYYTFPTSVSIQYDSEGVTIYKSSSYVGFYIPLEGINVSKRNFLKMSFKFNIDNLLLTVIFYYDDNRDGRWSGYGIDYVNSIVLSQTEMGWSVGEWYTIYRAILNADDPLVQIGIILTGDAKGTLTISNLEVWEETTP